MSQDMKVLVWDVETAPMLGFVWQAKTDWVSSRMLQHEVFLLSWAAKWVGDRKVISARVTGEEAVAQDDSRIVAELIDLIRQADILVAHNGNRFDVKVLAGRALLNQQEPLGHIHTIDTLQLAKGSFRLSHNSLDHLARRLGVPTKLGTSFDLWRSCYYGDEKALAKMDRYCRRDVRVLEDVYEKMKPYVKGLPRLQVADHDMEHACPHCGGENLQRRGHANTNAGTYQRWQCQDCSRWGRSRTGDKARFTTVPLR